MYNKIADIITVRSKNNEMIGVTDFIQIAELLLENKNVGKFVSSVNFDDNLQPLGAYGYRYNNIAINYKRICNLVINEESYYLRQLNQYERMLYKNLFLIGIFVHELEHAYQNKIMHLDIDTPEALITNITYRTLNLYLLDGDDKNSLIQNELDKTEFNNIKPTERTANIAKDKFMYEMMAYIDSSELCKEFMKFNLYKTQFTHYDVYPAPSLLYLNKLLVIKDICNPNYYKTNIDALKKMKMDIETKLKLGLYLDEQEKKELIKKQLIMKPNI